MSLYCGFLFPKKEFKLIFLNTIGYISDSVFYRLNMQTFSTEVVHSHPQGRSYQAFTANFKRQLIVLVDYGKDPTFYFEFHDQKRSFQVRNICPLEVTKVQLSLNVKYLAIVCGVPHPRIIFFDIQNRRVLGGSRNFIELQQSYKQLKRIQFNPSNPHQIAVQFTDRIQLHQLKQCFQLDSSQQLVQSISIHRTDSIAQTQIQTFIWDQINNIYLSNKKQMYIYSTDTKTRVLSYDIELDCDMDEEIVSSLVLTKKHIIVFYRGGRIEWLNKYYSDAMEEQEISLRPFYLDKYYETNRKIMSASYDGQFTKIFIAFVQGCFGILPKPAESNQQNQDQEQGSKKQFKSQAQKKVDLQLTLSLSYHTSPVVLIHEFENTSLCVTLSTAGRVILWSMRTKKQVQTHLVSGDVTCASVNKEGNVLATGHKNGVVRFYSIAKFSDIFLFKQFKLVRNGPIDKITFSTNGEQLAVLSREQNRIFYVLTSLSMQFQVLGYVDAPYQVRSIAWMGQHVKSTSSPKFQYLLASLGFGVMMVNSPVAVPTKKRGKQLQLKADLFFLRTDANQNLVCGLASGQIMTAGNDKLLKRYKHPEDSRQKVDFRSKSAPNPPIEQVQSHDFQVQIMHQTANFLITGGRQGKIHLRAYDNFKQFSQIKAYGWRNSTMSCVLGSWNEGLVYAAGKDGSFYAWKVGQVQIKGQDNTNHLQPASFRKIYPTQILKHYELTIQQEYLQKMKETIGKKKSAQLNKLKSIRQDLEHLLRENQKHDQLERLTRDEFAIDVRTKLKVAEQGRLKCQKIVEESKKKMLYNEVYAKKLKQITWDRMDVHLSAINGLKNNYIVNNYQLRKVTALEKRRVKLVLDLRRAQKIQDSKQTLRNVDFEGLRNRNVVNGGFVTQLMMTQIQAKKEDNKKDDKKKKKQDQQPVQANNQLAESAQQVPAQQEWSLLYSAFELFNPNAKRNQILMMKNLIGLIKTSFNKQFNKLIKLRQGQNQMINDKNKRIVQICQELKRQNQVIEARENILETNQGVLQFKVEEIPFAKYLSREERERLQKERLREQERLRKLAQDDAAQRALQKMMGGTLQQKKVSALQINVQKQKWMDKPPEEMNQEQKMKLKEYEQKRQKAEEQKERLVKKLEAELRKLKQEIDEVMERYDEKLFELLKRKIQYDYRIEQQELYAARLALTLLDQEEESRRYQELAGQVKESQGRLHKLEANRELLSGHEQEFEAQKEQKKQLIEKERLGEFQSKIKTIEKSVFQDYHSNIKKRREFQEKLLESNPKYRNQIIQLDPLKDIESRYLSEVIERDFSFFIHDINTLQQTFDIPENTIEKLIENRFNLRRQERELEEKQKILSQSANNLQESIEEGSREIARDEQQIALINQFIVKCKSDLDIQVRIKQGQVEINNQKPVPDLEGALLISKGQIDEKNSKIKQQANQKISVMKQIKTCKIKVTEQSLNLEKKQQHIDKLSAMIKEIQMLKVKKQMQLALSKKDTKINENELKSLKEQIQKVRKQGEKRIALYEEKIKKILKEIDTIKKENKQLQTQKWNLQSTVKQREKIKDMMCGDGQSGQQSTEKFDQISINRKLFDKAKQQTQQIELLRQQLSKLKAKTFANFSNVQR